MRSEILTLEWHQVDFEAGAVRLDAGTTKNREARTFYFAESAELLEVMKAERAYTDTVQRELGKIIPHVFHRNGERVVSFDKSWRAACKAVGIPGRLLHDFRRTAVRNLVRSNTPDTVAMKLTGHKTRAVFDRYNITSESDERSAIRRLPGTK